MSDRGNGASIIANIGHKKFNRKLVWALLLAAAFLMLQISTAKAQDTSDSLSAAEITRILEEAGFDVDMSEDKDSGDPVARASAGNIVFVVRAFDCSGRPKSCSQLMLFANFDLNREVNENDYKAVNSFNDSSRFGRAYVLGSTNQIGVDYMIDLTGGVTGDHVLSRLSRWESVIGDFIDEIRSAQTGS